jgi:hypothetical protein
VLVRHSQVRGRRREPGRRMVQVHRPSAAAAGSIPAAAGRSCWSRRRRRARRIATSCLAAVQLVHGLAHGAQGAPAVRAAVAAGAVLATKEDNSTQATGWGCGRATRDLGIKVDAAKNTTTGRATGWQGRKPSKLQRCLTSTPNLLRTVDRVEPQMQHARMGNVHAKQQSAQYPPPTRLAKLPAAQYGQQHTNRPGCVHAVGIEVQQVRVLLRIGEKEGELRPKEQGPREEHKQVGRAQRCWDG